MANGVLNSVHLFREELGMAVREVSIAQDQWLDPAWEKLAKQTNQEILNHAAGMKQAAREIFTDAGPLIERSSKNIERVQQKIAHNPFGAISDWIGFRINLPLEKHTEAISKIEKCAAKHFGVTCVKQIPIQYIDAKYKDKEFVDITKFIIAYVPEIGYFTEFQVNHPFASYVFASDTRLRLDPSCKEINLWDQDFYSDVKNYILDKANGFLASEERKAELIERAAKMHSKVGQTIPLELLLILNDL